MMKTTENTSGVISIISRAKIYDSEIGSYQEHFINENFNYTVRLSNGRIFVPRSMAQDEEVQPTSINEGRIQNVAKSFINDNPKPKTYLEENPIIEETLGKPKKIGFWARLFNLFGSK